MLTDSFAVRAFAEAFGSPQHNEASAPGAHAVLDYEWQLHEDPLAALDAAVEEIFEKPTRAGRRDIIRRRRIVQGWAVDAEGNPVYMGKRCCAEFLMQTNDVGLTTRNWLRVAGELPETLVCQACSKVIRDGSKCDCGGKGIPNSMHVCPGCWSVYKRVMVSHPVR